MSSEASSSDISEIATGIRGKKLETRKRGWDLGGGTGARQLEPRKSPALASDRDPRRGGGRTISMIIGPFTRHLPRVDYVRVILILELA